MMKMQIKMLLSGMLEELFTLKASPHNIGWVSSCSAKLYSYFPANTRKLRQNSEKNQCYENFNALDFTKKLEIRCYKKFQFFRFRQYLKLETSKFLQILLSKFRIFVKISNFCQNFGLLPKCQIQNF